MATNDMIRDRVGDLALERRDTIDMNVHRVAAPLDRVRWGAVFAGLFTTISTFVLLSVLGAAIGASTFDPGDNLNGLGASAGIWGAVTALIAFFCGWFNCRPRCCRNWQRQRCLEWRHGLDRYDSAGVVYG
jgi:hypothetical protein